MDAELNFKFLEGILFNAQAVAQVTHALEDGRGAT